ncbi:ral guanine nucleotide dissociation stimulator-like [Dasypus novemcinctus]|uniref:ral guanine nucleotide dissociation stimulator-like n=1 Tax=Dasypus novemcinctus TaxID=9361 RepID=UPI00265DB006|nr:ral guanine nucleotide dissociation stimulator-like [Dasypus novemcinctus]
MVQAGRWEALVEHLVPAWQEGDLGYVCTFLGAYRMFTSTEQVLDQLFHRSFVSSRAVDASSATTSASSTPCVRHRSRARVSSIATWTAS